MMSTVAVCSLNQRQALLGHYRPRLPRPGCVVLRTHDRPVWNVYIFFSQTLETVIHSDVDMPSWGEYALLTAGQLCSAIIVVTRQGPALLRK
jgi:hypothetical protein